MIERISLNIDDKEISILKGKKRDVFYIHSSGSDAEQWKHQIEDIGGYAIDLPNHGRSGNAEIGSVDDYAFYVSEAINHTCKKAVIAGHSLGGAVAQKVYLNHPEVCSGLILVGTGTRLRVLPEILENLRTESEKAIKRILEMGFFNKTREYEEIMEKYMINSRVLLHDLLLCDRFDLLEDYRTGKIKVNVPTLIVVGNEDRLTPVRYAEFLRDHIHNSELVVIEDASHMVMLEKPDKFNSALENFLKKIKI